MSKKKGRVCIFFSYLFLLKWCALLHQCAVFARIIRHGGGATGRFSRFFAVSLVWCLAPYFGLQFLKLAIQADVLFFDVWHKCTQLVLRLLPGKILLLVRVPGFGRSGGLFWKYLLILLVCLLDAQVRYIDLALDNSKLLLLLLRLRLCSAQLAFVLLLPADDILRAEVPQGLLRALDLAGRLDCGFRADQLMPLLLRALSNGRSVSHLALRHVLEADLQILHSAQLLLPLVYIGLAEVVLRRLARSLQLGQVALTSGILKLLQPLL